MSLRLRSEIPGQAGVALPPGVRLLPELITPIHTTTPQNLQQQGGLQMGVIPGIDLPEILDPLVDPIQQRLEQELQQRILPQQQVPTTTSRRPNILQHVQSLIPVITRIVNNNPQVPNTCGPLQVLSPSGLCVDLTPGIRTPAEQSLVNGQLPNVRGRLHTDATHADFVPPIVARGVRLCGRTHILGNDGYCHPKRGFPNRDRMYPKPRRPLGTPGDLNAVTKASRFGRRLYSNKKRLQKLERDLARSTGGRGR